MTLAEAMHLSGVDLAILDHERLAYGQKPVYLRLVTDLTKALDYARGGFHVAVARGQAGGCKSPASATPAPRGGVCPEPMNSAAAKEAWAGAAKAYYDVAQAIAARTVGLEAAKARLAAANAIADQAYGVERVPPPADPGPGNVVATTQTPPVVRPTVTVEEDSGPSWTGLLIAGALGALAGGIGVALKRRHTMRYA